jgi:hypothetical protein
MRVPPRGHNPNHFKRSAGDGAAEQRSPMASTRSDDSDGDRGDVTHDVNGVYSRCAVSEKTVRIGHVFVAR